MAVMRSMKFIDLERPLHRLLATACIFGPGGLGYFTLGRLFPPQLSTATAWDLRVPFAPEMVWVYLSVYPAFAVTALVLDGRRLARFLREIAVGYCIAFIAFAVYQTQSPRPRYLPGQEDLSGALYKLVTTLDRPTNACPSLHIVFVTLIAAHLSARHPRWSPFAAGWALLVAYSTLATRQHTLIDIAGGLLAALLAIALCALRDGRLPAPAPHAGAPA